MDTKNIGITLGAIVIFGLLIWGGRHAYISYYADTEPRMEDARREVFENTSSYIRGKTQEISKMRREFKGTNDSVEKAALREMILTSASTVDIEKLPEGLQDFIRSLE